MPREAQISPYKQRPTNPQETFRYSTPDLKVVARPVGVDHPALSRYSQPNIPNFMRANSEGGRLEAAAMNAKLLMNALDGISTGVEAYAKVKRIDNEESLNKGYYDALKGVSLTPEANFYEQMGHSLYQGEAAAVDYEKRILEAYGEKGHTASPEEWGKTLQDIKNEVVNGKDTFFLEGFSDKAKAVDHRYTTQFYTDQLKQRKEETLNNFSVTFSKELDDVVKSAGSNKEGVAVGLRNVLSIHQANAKAIGLSRGELAELAVKVVGERAEAEAKPWLMDFAFKPDDSGVKLSDTLANVEVNNYVSKALNRQVANEHKALAAMEKAERAVEKSDKAWLSEQLLNGVSVDQLIADPKGKAALGRLGPTAVLSIQSASKRADYADNYDPAVVDKYLDQARSAQLDMEALYKAVHEDRTISMEKANEMVRAHNMAKEKAEADTDAELTKYSGEEHVKAQVSSYVASSTGPESYVPTSVKSSVKAIAEGEFYRKLGVIKEQAAARNGGILTDKIKRTDKQYQADLDSLWKETKEAIDSQLKPYSIESEKPSTQSPTPTKTKGKYTTSSPADIIKAESLGGKSLKEVNEQLFKLENDGALSSSQINEILSTLYGKR